MIVEHLIADSVGTFIGKHQQRLYLSRQQETLLEAPLLHLRSVQVLSHGVSVSSDALEACCEQGIPVFFMDTLGHCYASVYAAGLGATVLTRRQQLLAYDDIRGLAVARAVTSAKLHNQAVTLKYMAKNRKEAAPDIYQELRLTADDLREAQGQVETLRGACIDEVRDLMMGIEGSAGQKYWAAVRLIVPDSYRWTTRENRGAVDPVNSLLNYGYGILYTRVEQALVLAGLDPYAGFLHADRPGKPSLVLDFIEEFRQAVVDRVVFGLVTRGFKVDQHGDGKLTSDTRRALTEHLLAHLDSHMRYDGKRFPLRAIIQHQARRMAAFLRGEPSMYQAFAGEW
jgi:CRISPR-associated protein Cas1